MRTCIPVLALTVLCALSAGCANRVRLPDVKRVESASIPPERRFHADEALRPTDIVEFVPLAGAPADTLVSVKAGNCDNHEGAAGCDHFLKTRAAFNNQRMAIGSKASLPVAALGCVTDFTIAVTGTNGGHPVTVSSAPVSPGQWGKCPLYSNDRWIGERELLDLLAVPVSHLVDVRIIRQSSARVLPGDAVDIIQRYQLGIGADEPTARPFFTAASRATLDDVGRLSIAAPSAAASPPCSDADVSCGRQRMMYSAASQSGLSVRLWRPEACLAQMPTLKDAELCLTAGWSADQLKALPVDEQARIGDICVRGLDIDLYQRQWSGRSDWENASLRLEPRQHWTLIGHDGATHVRNYAAGRSLQEELELAYRQLYGRPLIAHWFSTEAHVVIVPSPYRCSAERRALWMVHQLRVEGPSVLAQAIILPGDTVYFNYSAPSVD